MVDYCRLKGKAVGEVFSFSETRERLFSELYASMYPYSLKLTNDSIEAQDLTQEALFRVHNYLLKNSFDERATILTFTYNVAKNMFIDAYRKKKNLVAQQDFSDLEYVLDKSYVTNDFECVDFCNMIRSSLPYKQFHAWDLHRQGYKYKEISEQIGCPVGTVKNNIHKVREFMKEYI